MSLVKAFQKTAVFISGGGSCLQAVLELSEFQDIKVVVTNKLNNAGQLKAKRFGVALIQMTASTDFLELSLKLKKYGIQKIFLAGFMKLIPLSFLNEWQDQIFNIHPSLLPQFKGKNAFEASFNAKSSVGVSIHHVTAQMDAGQIVLQKIATTFNPKLSIGSAALYLRRTEQHLMREYIYRGSSLCSRF